MGSVDRVDALTFRVNVSGDGAAKLRETVRNKLKEFMGDYTDDTLVEYVIVLLRNGRRKEEARNELNVFLGDDSDPFVAWLWDHLASNLDMYVPPSESHAEASVKTQSKLRDQSGINDASKLDSESGRENSAKVPRSRHNREWKGLVRDTANPPPLRSSEINIDHLKERNHHKVNRGRSPSAPMSQKKRNRNEERDNTKRDSSPQVKMDASRRLLQFAVRDAVGKSMPANATKEPSLKRLRSVVSTSGSVVSTSGVSSLPEHPRRLQSVARLTNPMANAMKAVSEAAEDAVKARSANVFDRLGRVIEVSGIPHEHAEFKEFVNEDDGYGDFNQTLEGNQSLYLQRIEYSRQQIRNVAPLESRTGLVSDFLSDNEGYGDYNAMDHSLLDISQTGISRGNKVDDSFMVQYNVANDNEALLPRRNTDRRPSVGAVSSSRKVVNVSVNVNTWKASHYEVPGEVSDLPSRRSNLESVANVGKSRLQLINKNGNPVAVGNGSAKPVGDIQNESPKSLPSGPGSHPAGHPLEDVDSRIIFVSNVHFAATKDSLSRHFMKFGEVLKVTIVTDAATGQPKGSAYIEFMGKDAADNALSLDGTSFMSRIVKVVKKSSANQETAAPITRPQIDRGSSLIPGRFPRASFARGMPGAYKPWLAVKPGARSFQWKRDAQPTPSESSVPGLNIASTTPTGRGLTYVRTETKVDGNPGTT